MSRIHWMLKLWTAAAVVAMLVILAAPMWGQQTPQTNSKTEQTQTKRTPMIEDWSTHHVVFSNPGTYSQWTGRDKPFLQWYKIQNDPRYQLDLHRRTAAMRKSSENGVSLVGGPTTNFLSLASPGASTTKSLATATTKPKGDWSQFLGGTTAAGMTANAYPAKYSYDIYAAPSCLNDFVVVPVNKAPSNGAGATGKITVAASYCAVTGSGVSVNGVNLQTAATLSSPAINITGTPVAGDTVTISGKTYQFESSNGSCSSSDNCVQIPSPYSSTTEATNLAAAINATSCFNYFLIFYYCPVSANTAVTAGAGGSSVTLSPKCAGSAADPVSLVTISDTAQMSLVDNPGSDGVTSGQQFALGASNVTTADNIATAITNNTATTLSTGSANASGVVTVTADVNGAAGNGIVIAAGTPAFTSGVTFTSPTSGGADGQATIMAFNNLYTGGGIAATQLGTAGINGASSGSYITINGQTLTASNPTKAYQTGTFYSPPTASSAAIKVVNGANTLTVTTNATASTIVGTTAAVPAANTQVLLTSGANTVTLSNGGTAAHATGTFAAAPYSTSSISINSNGNTMVMKPSGTGSTIVGTAAGTPVKATTVSLTSGNSNTLVLSNGGAGAHATGTFSAAPLGAATISINSNGNTLTMTPGGTGSTIVGTAAGTPASNTTVSLTSGSNTLVLSNGGTAAKVTGTFASNPSNGATVSITSGSNTVQLTATTGTQNKGTITVTARPASSGNTLQIGTVTYTFESSCGSTSNCISRASGGSNNTYAGNIYAAISDNTGYCTTYGTGSGCFANISAANPDVTATLSSNVVTVTNTQSSSITFTTTSSDNITLSPSSGTIAGPTGTNGCTNSTTGTFVIGSSTTNTATNLSTAINACNTSYAAVATTATSSTNTVTATDTVPGAFTTFSGASSIGGFWGSVTAGTNGSGACTSSTAGTYATSNVTGTLASNLSAAINACNTSYAAVGATSVYSTGSTFTVTDAYPGSGTTFSGSQSNAGSIFSWGSVTAGTNGSSSTCSGTAPTFTGTFATSTNTTTLAGNLNTAMGVCAASVGFSTATSTNTVTVTDLLTGSGTTFTPSDTNTTTPATFSWGSTTAGTNGSNACTSTTAGTYAASLSTSSFASNLSAAITACNTSYATVGATSSYSTGNTFTVTDAVPGSGLTIAGATNAPSSIFLWGTPTAGTNGSASCSSSTVGTYATSNVVATLANNLVSALNACTTAYPAVAVAASYTSGGSFTATDTTLGAGTFTPSVSNATGIFSWGSTTAGTTGSNTCTSATAGTYAIPTTAALFASNLSAAITACNTSYAAVGATSAYSSGNSFTVSDTTLGSGVTLAGSQNNAGGIFSWGSVTAGSNGTIGCTGSTTGTYATSTSLTSLASNLRAAINLCTSADGLTQTSNSTGAQVTITAATPGTGGNSITVSPTASGYFQWGGTSLANGTNGTNSSSTFAYWSGSALATPAQLASNLVTAINDDTANMAVTAAASGNIITVTATTTGPGAAGSPNTGNFIPVTSDLFGFQWGGPTLQGGVASGLCGSGQPSVMWAYNASTASTGMLGSPALSYDGTQVAFIESGSTGALLHILTPYAGDGGTNLGAPPVAPSHVAVSGADYVTCHTAATESCMYTVALGSNNNTNSQPFYDFNSDTLWVGDNGGLLWEVSPVFNGPPAVVWSGITVDSGAILTGPVEDYVTGNIIVGDSLGKVSFVTSGGSLGGTQITGLGNIADSPMLDSVTGTMYVFAGKKPSTGAVVVQSNMSLTSQTTALVGGSSSSATNLHIGAFDEIYYASPNGTGNLYVCGKQSGSDAPALYAIPLNATVMGTPTTPLALTSPATANECSPLSEVDDPNEYSGTDWLFLGVPSNCAYGTGTTAGCLMSFDITNGFPAAAYAAVPENGGTTGITIDNLSTSGQASSAYFLTLTSPGAGGCTSEPANDSTTCLVKRTQAGLQ